jgi:hypothetical protein
VNDKKTQAGAPTGIAAANVEIEGTDVSANTIHTIFDLDTEFKTKLDFAKLNNKKVAELMKMDVLLLDEVSMMDVDCWATIVEMLSIVDHNRRANVHDSDPFGQIHVILFGDFKQLPPATSKAPFIVTPSVIERFDFRVLRENRRVVADATRSNELQLFHEVLTDISWGKASGRVRDFLIAAYVKGACTGPHNVDFEGNTSVFTKRRYRDKWNRTVVRRVAKTQNHSLKIKGRCRARGARGQFFNDRRCQFIRRRVRTQAMWNLHLAGDWHLDSETKPLPMKPHMMRVMLVSNLAVDQRFANGSQGRLLHWYPGSVETNKALPASYPDLIARFVKETALSKREMFPDLDHMDVTARQESLALRGDPILLQLPVVPSYALTVHKVQALSIKHEVVGCLEGVFAQGQVYVLVWHS